MITDNQVNHKEQLTVLGSIIKINRLTQNMSQQALCQGICVPSYLSKIENGEIVPSLELISDLFDSLGISYEEDEAYIGAKRNQMEQFYEELNFSGFAMSEQLFKKLEAEEERLIHSPLVIDYYLTKFAYYCGTEHREQFESAKKILIAVITQLTSKQKHRYYFYQGIDILLLTEDMQSAASYFSQSNQYGTSGNSLNFLGIAMYQQGSYFEAIQYLQEAGQLYMKEGNLVAMVFSFECLGLLSYKLGSFNQAVDLLQKAVSYAQKLGRHDLMTTPLLGLGYHYYQRGEYEQAKHYLEQALEIKNELKLIWSDLFLIDFYLLEVNEKLNHAPYSLDDILLCSNVDGKITVALKLLYTCYQSEHNQKVIEDLYQVYKQQKSFKLYLDEMVREAMLTYYLKVRKYKEVCTLLRHN